jgi:predicted nucleic acid-binding protein
LIGLKEMDSVFLDASVLSSAAYRPEGGLSRLWKLAKVRLITSVYAVDEARRNLSQEAQREALARLLQSVEVMPGAPAGRLPKGVALPEKDAPILLAAIHAKATHLITGDKKHFGRYFGRTIAGVRILPPAAYLRGHAVSMKP